MTIVAEPSIPSVLRERASLQANEKAFTYIDYEQDWDGVSETITYSQLYRRSLNVAQEVRRHGSTGDRAVIVAPQGLSYIDAFFGALQAGLIPVPLSVPLGGVVDERVKSVLLDAEPSVVLTTSAVAGDVAEYIKAQPDGPAPSLVEVDLVDLDARSGFRPGRDTRSETAYLQYTSGSTRAPAGVEITYRNLMANFEQMMADYFADTWRRSSAGHHLRVVAAVLPRHGFAGRSVRAAAGGACTPCSPARCHFWRDRRGGCSCLASNTHAFSAGPNFAFEVAARKTSDEEMAGFDLSDVIGIINGSERVQPATLKRFTERFAPFNFPATALRPSYGMAEATVYMVTRKPVSRTSFISIPTACPTGGRSGAKARMAQRLSATACRAHRSSGLSTPTPTSNARRTPSVKSGSTATTSPPATGASRKRPSTRSAESCRVPRRAPPRARG